MLEISQEFIYRAMIIPLQIVFSLVSQNLISFSIWVTTFANKEDSKR